jgi:CheY-like chemotaxis protein
MKRQNVRVLLASEFPGTRSFLRSVVENENKAVIVAEAENGTRAMNLARTMRPDVALIDSHLPYVVGINDLPLSRVGGLDIAQSISEEIPNMHVVLLNSLDGDAPAGREWRSGKGVLLCEESENACIPFTLGELSDRAVSPGSLVFANVESTEESMSSAGRVPLSDKLLLAGIISVVAGWLMVLTMFLATVGLVAILGGALTALAGFVGKKLSARAFGSRVAP